MKMVAVAQGSAVQWLSHSETRLCSTHQCKPFYDFNDEALPIGASLFARLVEKKFPRLSDT